MWIQVLVYSLLLAAIVKIEARELKINGINTFRNNIQKNKAKFEDRVLREFDTSKILLSFKEEDEIVDDITVIKGKYLITLRDLKRLNEPELKISSVNSSLDYFSMVVNMNVDDILFSGKININEDTKPVGNFRYTLKNVRGFGIVGLGVGHDGNFISTNYIINYNYKDDTEIESTWKEEKNFDEWIKLNCPYFSEIQIEKRIRQTVEKFFIKSLDATLARISIKDIFEMKELDVLKIQKMMNFLINDDIVDGIINDLNMKVKENGMVEITIPDFDTPFAYNIIGSLTINGEVEAREGWIRNLSTFVRQGPVGLTFQSGNFIIFGSLGLTELKLGYKVCKVKIEGIGPSGEISGEIRSNTADLIITINVRNQTITLTSFKIKELSDFDVQLTGLGPLNWLASKIAGWIIEKAKSSYIPTIEPIIKEQLDQVLANLDFTKIAEKLIL